MSIMNDIPASFYSAAFYAELAHARRGIGMKLMLALTMITTLLTTGYLLFYSNALYSIAGEVPNFAKDLPAIAIKDGKFSMDKPSPYNLPIGTGNERIWISVNTGYKVSDLNALRDYMAANKIVLLVTADEAITVKQNDNSLKIQSFKDFDKDISVTHDQWMSFAKIIAEKGVQFLIIASFFLMLVGLLIYNLLATFISALIIMIISVITRSGLEFGAAMRLAAAARIPYCAIVSAPLMLGGAALTGGVSWLLWLSCLVFAVIGSKRGA